MRGIRVKNDVCEWFKRPNIDLQTLYLEEYHPKNSLRAYKVAKHWQRNLWKSASVYDGAVWKCMVTQESALSEIIYTS